MAEDSHISKPTEGQIEFITRAIIIDDGKILLCMPVGKDYYFLPGGHVEFSEFSQETLDRELIEELGVPIRRVHQVGIVENVYDDNDYKFKRHELNLLYEVQLVSSELKATEQHIEFKWVNLRDLEKIHLLPDAVKKFVMGRTK